MVVWEGHGLLAGVLPLLLGLAAAFGVESLGEPGTLQTHGRLIYGTVALISGGLLVVWERRLSRRPKRVLVDKETGTEIVLGERHTLWFVPLRFWAWLLVAGGTAAIVVWLAVGSARL